MKRNVFFLSLLSKTKEKSEVTKKVYACLNVCLLCELLLGIHESFLRRMNKNHGYKTKQAECTYIFAFVCLIFRNQNETKTKKSLINKKRLKFMRARAHDCG